MSDDVLRDLQHLHDLRSQGLSDEETARVLLDLTLQAAPPDLSDAVRVCAIPAWFDAGLLALLTDQDEEEAAALLEQIAAFSFVLPREGGGYVYQRATRVRLLDWWQEPEHAQRFAVLNDCLAQRYLALVREQGPRLSGPDYLDALAVLEAEYPNIHVAQAWAVEKYDWELARGFAYTLADYFWRLGPSDEWIAWTEARLEASERAGDAEYSARMQSGLGVAYRNLPVDDRADNLQKAITCYREALHVYTLEASPLDYAMTQYNLGNTYADMQTGDWAANLAKAIECYREALRVYTPEAAPFQHAMTLNSLGTVYRRLATRERAAHQTTITWLHLSDLHFQESRNYDERIVLDALLHDVAECIRKNRLQPDFIIVSGDIAFASRPEEYALAQQFFENLLKATDLPNDRLFLVPGNHDVDRNAISALAAGATTILTDRDAVNRFLANDADRALVFNRFHNYRDFINEYLGKDHIPFDDSRYFYVKSIEVASRHVAILGLNSAWLAGSDEDRHRLLLGEQQVRAAFDMAKDAELYLVVMHHPFEWLQDSDRNDVESLLCRKCDFVLQGHMHQVGLLQARTPDTEAMIIAAGACYKARDHPNSYNFVQLDPSTGKGKVYLRMYSDKQGGFWTRDVLNYHNAPDGEYAFVLV